MELFDKKLFPMTSLVSGSFTANGLMRSLTASVFFIQNKLRLSQRKKGPQWVRIDNYWFITNRHVVLPTVDELSENEYLLDNLVLNLRKTDVQGGIEWFPISLDSKTLKKKIQMIWKG